MYAAVRRYEGILDDAEAARLVRDSFLPQLDDIPGFIGYYWVDAGGGTITATGTGDGCATLVRATSLENACPSAA